jgi:predicted PurR-regulated permease PerM
VKEAIQSAANRAHGILAEAPDYLSGAATVALYFVLIPFVGFYLLAGGPGFFQSILNACPGRWVEKFLSLLYEIDEVLGNYLRAIFLEALVVGLLSTVGLLWLGLDQAVLVGAMAGLGNLVPYLGPVIGGLAGMAAAFFQFQNVLAPLQVAALFASIKFFDDWFLQPYIMKRSVELHPIAVVFAVMCGGHVGGLWGLLFAVPVACILKEVGKIISVWYMSEMRMKSLPKDTAEAAAKPWIV